MVKGTMDVAALAKKLSEKLRGRQRLFYFDLIKTVFMCIFWYDFLWFDFWDRLE